MSRTLSQREAPFTSGGPANDERWELVQRIATSRFSKAPQLREILFYICQRALADPSATIKEYEIGCNVLGRRPDFNPNDDNIVRVQVSHLRKKLEEYFSSDGKDEPLQITVPKGSYIPRFEPKVLAAPMPVLVEAEKPLPEPVRESQTPRLLSWILIPSLAVCVLAACALAISWRYLSKSGPLVRAAASAANHPPAQDPLLSRIFGGDETGIVVSDTCLVMLQDILHTDISVAEYSATRQYPEELLQKESDPKLRSALELLAGRQYTSLADTNIASRLRGLSQQFANGHAFIRFARHVNIRDFKTQNFVLIGSRRGIPWVQLFEPQLNFALEEEKADHHFYFRNRNPKSGEQATYVPSEINGTLESYADIALLPNLGNTGSVLILSGITMEASEAAGELVAGGALTRDLTRMLGAQAIRERYFEVLLKTRSTAGAVSNSQIVTYRVIQPTDAGNN
ncbi:MAG TPA: hypothetical protein VGG97_29210 [Bryobacteraceae bacterium]